MADTPESKIFRKLADALTFHPAGAKLFMPDWTLEPGDIVTVSSDDEDYDVPIYSMDFKWNGQGMADVQSTGNQKREPLSALRRKEYQSGRRGAGRIREIEEEFQEFDTWKVETDETLENHAGQFVEILGEDGEPGRLTIAETNIGQTASDAYIIATAAGIKLDENGHPELDEQGHYQYDPNAGNTTLTARINTNATNIDLKVSQQDLTTTLSSYLLINSFGTELGTTLDNGNSTLAAKIITAIDRQEGESMVTIDADQINLDGVVTAVFLDSRMANIDSLFSTTGYFGGINVHSITTNGGGQSGDGVGTITGDILYATSQLSIGHGAGSSGAAAGSFYYQGVEYTPKTVKKAGEVQNNIKLFGTGTDTEIDIGGSGILDASVANNVLTLTKSDGTTTVNFSKATALNTGSVEADGETKQAGWSSGMFTVIATQTNKNTSTNQYETNEVGRTTTSLTIPLGHWGDPTQSEDPNTYYQGISAVIGSSLSAVDTGKSIQVNATPRYNAGKNSVGLAPMSYTAFEDENYPSSQTIYTDTTGRTDASGTEDNLHRDITLSLDVDDSYVYMKHGSDVIARITNTGSGAAYSDGYTDGQDNAFASIKSIEIDEGSASYASSNLSVNITAVSQLSLIKQDETTTQSDGESETVAQTLPVAVTDVTISDSSIVYNNNRTYTIGGSGGNVNIGAVNGVGGADIPVDTNAYPFTPTEALNAVNVVKGIWTGTTTKTIEFTTDAPSPAAGSSKSVSLTLDKGSWTWEAEDGGGGNYKTQVQVKDGSAGILTDYVDLPGLSLDVDTPQQQDSWWHQTGTYAYQYVVPQIGAVPYLSSDTSKQNPLGYYHNNNIVINPSQAIEHGKSLVSVTRTWTEYEGTPSGDTTLDPGKTYHLEVKKDSTTVYDELYTVPEQADPTVGDWQLNYQSGTNYTYKTKVKVNGTWYESDNLSAANAYDNGWTGSYGEIGISPTTVNALNPGESVTVSAQGKQASGSPSKTTVESVTVSARALNLKDETFTANDTYAVPAGYDGYGAITVNVQGSGGSDRRAVFLDNITLTAPANPEPGFNWQFTESSFAHYTDPVSVETDATKKTQVTIDASAIYQAGVSAGSVGNVDVVKGAWSTNGVSQIATCEFTTSTGTGDPKSVTIKQSARENTSTARGYVDVLDDQETISTAIFQMELASNGKSVALYHATNAVAMVLQRNRTQIATISVNGSETPIIEADVDDIVKNPTENVTYSDNYKTAYIPVQALDESDNELLSKVISVSVEGAWNDGHTKGVEEGSGIKIEQEKEVTASQNNTTITVLPTYTGSDQYDAMGSVKVNVQVPTYEGISSASIIDQSETEIITWQKELGTKTLSSQYGQIKVTGNDGSTKRLVVDAHQVYQNGMNAGAGVQIKDEERKTISDVQTNITITPTSVNGVNYEAMRKAIVYVNLPRIKDTEDVGDITVGSSSTTLNVTPTGGYGAMKKVTGTIKVNYSNPTITVAAYPGAKTGQDVIGAYTVSQNRYVAITASANGKSTTKYINLSKG